MSAATGQERGVRGAESREAVRFCSRLVLSEDSPFELRLKRRRSRVRLGSAGKSALG